MYIELNYTLNKLVLGTAVSAFTTRPQPRFYSIKKANFKHSNKIKQKQLLRNNRYQTNL